MQVKNINGFQASVCRKNPITSTQEGTYVSKTLQQDMFQSKRVAFGSSYEDKRVLEHIDFLSKKGVVIEPLDGTTIENIVKNIRFANWGETIVLDGNIHLKKITIPEESGDIGLVPIKLKDGARVDTIENASRIVLEDNSQIGLIDKPRHSINMSGSSKVDRVEGGNYWGNSIYMKGSSTIGNIKNMEMVHIYGKNNKLGEVCDTSAVRVEGGRGTIDKIKGVRWFTICDTPPKKDTILEKIANKSAKDIVVKNIIVENGDDIIINAKGGRGRIENIDVNGGHFWIISDALTPNKALKIGSINVENCDSETKLCISENIEVENMELPKTCRIMVPTCDAFKKAGFRELPLDWGNEERVTTRFSIYDFRPYYPHTDNERNNILVQKARFSDPGEIEKWAQNKQKYQRWRHS